MGTEQGIVLERREGQVLVLTPDGRFRRVAFNGEAAIGAEVSVEKPRSRVHWWPLATAAIVVLLIGATLFSLAPSEVIAYVAVDINPGLEIGLDRELTVASWKGYDPEGTRLGEVLAEGMPLEQALEMILAEAIHLDYLECNGDETVLLASLVLIEEGRIDLESLEESIGRAMISAGVSGRLGTAMASAETREEAAAAGLSANRFILWKAALEAGVELEPSELKGPVGKVIQHLGAPPGHVFREHAIGARPLSPPGLMDKDEGPQQPSDKNDPPGHRTDKDGNSSKGTPGGRQDKKSGKGKNG